MPSFKHCSLSLRLRDKLLFDQIKEGAKEYEAGGMDAEAALLRASNDALELAKLEERSIVKAVRGAYEAKGGKPRAPAPAAKAPETEAAESDSIGALSVAEPVEGDEKPAKSETPAKQQRTIEVDGVRRPITNSRGQLVGQNFGAQQAFWKWFGDSKAVDEQGRPSVVFHGTKADIKEFNTSIIGSFFTSNSDTAAEYGSTVMPAYLVLENPLVVDAQTNSWDAIPFAPSLEEVAKKAGFDFHGYEDGTIDTDTLSQLAKKAGFDGLIVRNVNDAPGFGNSVTSSTVLSAFSAEQIKSATGNAGTFDPNNPDILFSKMPVFYSALARTIPDMAKVAGKDGTIKPEQARLWLQARQKEGKFKADELQWSGVDDWLRAQADRVAVADIAQFVEENGVQVKEVEKAQKVASPNDKTERLAKQYPEHVARLRDQGFELAQVTDEDGNERLDFWHQDDDYYVEARYLKTDYGVDTATFNAAKELSQAFMALRPIDPTKYSQYVLPGGENYRELLLTLPNQNTARLAHIKKRWDEKGDFATPDDKEFFLANGHGAAPGESKIYRSSHWDEANIIAHVRFNDRTDVDGKRVLFIEELQSDWGQEGLKKGFGPARAATDEEKAEWQKLEAMPWKERTQAEAARLDELDQLVAGEGDKIAPAPFVTDTKAWLSLGIKRMIRYAAENGYDRVAFVNGEQSADRYDLSKQISKVVFYDNSSGGIGRASMDGDTTAGTVDAYDLNGNRVIEKYINSPDELADIIGKDAAKKLLESAPEPASVHGLSMRRRKLEGLELKVGGEGMKTFYDKIVPQTINEVLKKLGGGKAAPIRMGNADELRAQAGEARRAGMVDGAAEIDTDAKAALGTQLGFDITPELRASALDGLPMFSKGFDPARRQLLAAAAAAALSPAAKAGDVAVGKAKPIDAAVLAKRVDPAVEKILRDSQASGTTSLNGAKVLRQAMKAIALTGPKEVRALAAQIEQLLPATGQVMLTVDDTRRMNVHGAVELSPAVHLSLFTADGRTGLTYETLLHESLHVAVAARYRSLGVGLLRSNDSLMGMGAPAAAKVLAQFKSVWEEFRMATASEKFGNRDLELAVTEARGNPDEFFVRTLTDPVLQAYMTGRRYEGKTLFQRFKEWVTRSLFGIGPEEGVAPSWLDAALAASGDVAQAMSGDRADFSRMAAISRAQAQRQNSRVDRDDANRMNSKMPDPAWDDPDMTRLDNIIHTLQDKHIDTKRVVQAVRAEMADLEDKWDPYLQEELFHGRAATGFKFFLHGELRPLLTDLQARGVTLEDFEEYLHNRHAEEANKQVASVNPDMPDGGSGIKTKDAQDYLAMLAPARAAAFEALAARVDAITAGTDKLLVEYGLDKQSVIDAWHGAYKHYVPLMREDMDAGKRGNGTGQGFSVRGPSSKRRTGSSRNVVNILANIAMQRERAIVRGEKNRLGVALYGLSLKAPNPEFWRPINPQKNPAALREELTKLGLPPELVDNFLAPPTRKAVVKIPGVAHDPNQMEIPGVPPERHEQVVRVRQMIQNLPGVVAVRVGGEDRFVFFNEGNERALRMATTLKNMGNDQLNRFLTIAGSITRAFAAINTQYNPIFGITNLIRDTGEGALNLSATPLAGRQHEVVAEAARLLGHSVVKGFRLDQLTGADAAMWDEFQREGGTTGFRAMFANSDDRAKELMRELHPDSWMDSKWGKVFTAGGALKVPYSVARKVSAPLFDWLSDYNESLENVTRMAAYKVAKAHGMSNQQAASLAKNLTVNFNRKGAVGSQVGSLYAFFNAAVQGTARMATTLASPAGKKIIGGGLLLGVIQAVMMAAAGYDDEEPPEFIKQKNIVLPLGWVTGRKNYLTVPMPLGFAIIPTLSRLGTEFALHGGKKAGKYTGKMLDAIADTFNPIGNAGFSLQTIAPTAVDPFAALAENRDYTGKPIARKDLSALHPTPGYTRTKETASGVSKTLAYYLNTWSGGTKYTPGALSPTPDQIDYLLGQFTGGVGREALKAQQTVSSTISGEELPPYKIPLVGRFYGNADSKSSQSAKFYDNLLEVNLLKEELEGRAKDHADPKAFLAEHPDARLADLATATERELSELRKHKRELVEKGGSRARVKEIEARITNRMKRFNEKVEEVRKKAPA